jgi:hypothetical protein
LQGKWAGGEEGVELRSTDPPKLRAGSRGGCPHMKVNVGSEAVGFEIQAVFFLSDFGGLGG